MSFVWHVYLSRIPLGTRLIGAFLVACFLVLDASAFCLDFERLLVGGEWSRMFLFPFAVSGLFHLFGVLVFLVLVSSSVERRLGSSSFLVRVALLLLLHWSAVLLFALFALITSLVAASALPALPALLTNKLPVWKPCPSGFSG